MLPFDALPELPYPRGYLRAEAAADRQAFSGDGSAPAPAHPSPWEAELDAAVELALGEAPESAPERFAALRERAPDERARIVASLDVCFAQLSCGDLAAASRTAADALRAARRLKDEAATAQASLSAGLVDLARGRRNSARTRFGEAVRGFARVGDAGGQIRGHYLLGEVAWLGEDGIRAGAHYRDALGIARNAGAQEWIELLTLRFEHR